MNAITSTSASPTQIDSALLASLNGSTAKKDDAKDINDRFLKLLVAQMNNQDPLNPLDNAQVTTQMAQINTVTGINNLTSTVTKMLQQLASTQAIQAAQLTGRSVLVSGNAIELGAHGAQGGVDLAGPADRMTVEIRDANGQLTRTLSLGAQAQGIQSFTWDGLDDAGTPAAAGNYTFSAKATSGSQAYAVSTLAAARVEGVRQNGDQMQLIVSGIGPIAYGDIKQIL